MKKLVLALLLIASPASAQWQTPDHSIPIGNGVGTTGFNSAAPGAAGVPLVSTGPTTDPAFGPISNAGMVNMTAPSIKGAIVTGPPVDLSPTQVTGMLNPFVGDSGAGGVKGEVPAPAAGDAALLKVLGAGGGWTVLNPFVGDSGAGGAKGQVPAPAAGDAAAGKVLGAGGGWVSVLPWRSPMQSPFNAVCDGTTDDKTALQAWLDALPNTYIGYVPPGITCAFGNGSGGTTGNGLIFVKSNSTIIAPGGTLKVRTVSPLNSGLMLTDPTQGTAAGPTNVRISGLNLDGNQTARGCTTVPGPTQCSGGSFYIISAQDIWIRDVKCVQGAADCFYVGGNDTLGLLSRRVYMNNITCAVATRNCLSLVGVTAFSLQGCNMTNAGTAPGHGIDVEPDGLNTTDNDIFISHCELNNNGGSGIAINPGAFANAVNRGFGFMISASSNTQNGFNQNTTPRALNGWKFAGAFGSGNTGGLFGGTIPAADSLP